MSKRTRMCVICKQLIESERAAAMEQTNLCSEHGEAINKFGGEFRMAAQQESLQKPGSMKKNPGGVATRLIRNMEALERLREEFASQKKSQGDSTTEAQRTPRGKQSASSG